MIVIATWPYSYMMNNMRTYTKFTGNMHIIAYSGPARSASHPLWPSTLVTSNSRSTSEDRACMYENLKGMQLPDGQSVHTSFSGFWARSYYWYLLLGNAHTKLTSRFLIISSFEGKKVISHFNFPWVKLSWFMKYVQNLWQRNS